MQLDTRLVPNLFVIGAMKAGTNSMYRYLTSHPNIVGSNPKEPCFFVGQDELRALWPFMARDPVSHDPKAYLDMFRSRPARYRFDGSVYYSTAPHCRGVPARIAAASPDAKIIYVVRHPVTRTLSHYWESFRWLQETRSMDEAITEGSIYIDTSCYAMQLKCYLEHFDQSAVKVILSEDLRTRRRAVLEDLFRWLDVEPLDWNDTLDQEFHLTDAKTRVPRFRFVRMARDSAAWHGVRPFVPEGARKVMERLAVRKVLRNSFDDSAARAFLTQYFEARAGELDALIGADYERRWFPNRFAS